jgi:hypothetical protein
MTPNKSERRQPNELERDLLLGFARMEIGLDELLVRLHGMLQLDFGTHERKLVSHFLLPEPGIRIELSDVRDVMAKHWRGEVSDIELYRWALMLLLNDAYDWEGPDEDEIAEILNDLAMPPKVVEK